MNPGVDGGLLESSWRYIACHKPLHLWPYEVAASGVHRVHNGRVDEWDLIYSRE